MGPLQLLASIYLLGVTWGKLEYPDPRIVIVGPTGSGKSSLSNALLGCDPRGDSCVFAVCGGMDSCTKETSIGTGSWLGTGQNFTVVDTPGFGDSDGQDNELIEEMIKVLDDDLGYTNTILLLLDGTTARFTTGLHNMLRQMSALFGEAWWDSMVIGVSKWEYSKAAIYKRKGECDYFGDPSEHCKNEDWFKREITQQLQNKFNLDRNFTFVFIHSHSQSGPNLNDQVQQDHYQAEANILWDAATTEDSRFDFKTIDDVLEENELLKKKNLKLEFDIETNIATLYSLVRENEENTKKVVDNMHLTPVGSIIAWVNKPTADGQIVEIPAGWQRCDGSIIPRPSIWAGKLAPNLNHEKRFLRGGSDEEMLTMEEDTAKLPNHKHIDEGHTHYATSSSSPHSHGYSDQYKELKKGNIMSGRYWAFHNRHYSKTTDSTTVSVRTTIQKSYANLTYVDNIGSFATETRPKNMNIIYIMRVW